MDLPQLVCKFIELDDDEEEEDEISFSPNADPDGPVREILLQLCESISAKLLSSVDSLVQKRNSSRARINRVAGNDTNYEDWDDDDDESDDGQEEDDHDQQFLHTERKPGRDSSAALLECMNLRSVLGHLSSNEMTRLTEKLTACMTKRIDSVEDLVPSTMDIQGNEAIFTGDAPAITLTRIALAAATVYAQMASLPGALGSGLIHMQALSALLALVRRWKVEINAQRSTEMTSPSASASSSSMTGARSSNRSNTIRNNKKRRKRVPQSPSPSSKRSSKRSRLPHVEPDDSPDVEREESTRLVSNNDESSTFSITKLSPRQLLIRGLRLAQQLASIPIQIEFMSWSSEARECILEATSLVLFTSSAVGSISKRKNQDDHVLELANQTEDAASASLERCILVDNSCNMGETPSSPSQDHGNVSKRHEIAVVILRGLYPAICMREDLPCGEQGRQLAAGSACRVLNNFLREVSDDIRVHGHRWPASIQNDDDRTAPTLSSMPASVARSGRKSTVAFQEAVTPKSSRKANARIPRSSLGAPSRGGSVAGAEVATPARIKGDSRTPRTLPRSVALAASRDQAGALLSPTTTQSRPPRLVLSAFVGILQKLITEKGLERSAARNSAVATVHKCVEHLPRLERTHFLKFLIQNSYSKVSVHRLVTVETLGALLAEPWLWPGQRLATTPKTPSQKEPVVGWTPMTDEQSSLRRRNSLTPLVNKSSSNMPAALLGALQGRIHDKVSSVRSASISAFSKVIGRVNREYAQNKSSYFSSPNGMVVEALSEKAFSLACALRVRASLDDKSLVRKAAVEALVEILILAETYQDSSLMRSLLSEDDIEIFIERCKDPSVTTRKAAAEALTYLFQQCVSTNEDVTYPCFESLISAWTSSVLPMVLNVESSVASKAVELVNQSVLRPLLHGSIDGATRAAWFILATLGGGPERTRVSRIEPEAMRKALAAILEMEAFPLKTLLEIICTVASDETNADDFVIAGAWSLCNALVATPETLKKIPAIVKRHKLDLTFLCHAWGSFLESLRSPTKEGIALALLRSSMQHSMHVMAQLAPCFDPELAGTTKTRLLGMLSSYSIPPEAIGPAISALTSLTIAENPNRTCPEHRSNCSDWIQSLFRSGEQYLVGGFSASLTKLEENTIVRLLCTCGEASMVGFSPTEEDGATEDDRTAGVGNTRGVELVTGLHIPPSKRVIDMVQLCMGESLPCADTVSTPHTIRAHAFVAFGRFCLRDVELARSGLNILARELHQKNMSSQCPSIQCNSLLIMGDLCVKFTNLVDRYLPVMAACLQSGITDMNASILTAPASTGFAPVRKSAVILLSGLIMQDYIKWRGLLFHRFLVATTDEDEEVADIAEAILSGPLAMKQPKLFFNHFVECFFVLNCCTAHPIYVAAACSGDGGSGIAVGFDGINLKGEAMKARRFRMYELMLSKMSDQEKLEVAGRISKDILAGALVEGSKLYRACTDASSNESVFNVLSDALHIMMSRNIRVGKTKSNGTAGEEDEDDIEDPNMPNPARRKAAAMGRLLSNISRKHMVESVLPILCNLKTILQKNCSPLLKELMAVVVEMFRLYKTEVDEFLANDPTLLQEIEYDARRYQKDKLHQVAASTPAAALFGVEVQID